MIGMLFAVVNLAELYARRFSQLGWLEPLVGTFDETWGPQLLLPGIIDKSLNPSNRKTRLFFPHRTHVLGTRSRYDLIRIGRREERRQFLGKKRIEVVRFEWKGREREGRKER